MIRNRFAAALPWIVALLLSVGSARSASGQVKPPWSPLHRLSGAWGEASEASVLADLYGNVHAFWAETGFEDGRTLILYSRFAGQEWSEPAAVYASWPGSPIGSVSAAADIQGNLHLAWTEGFSGPVFYSTAPMEGADSARNWKPPARVDLDALKVDLQVDSEGIVHLLFVNYFGEDPGIYYTRTANAGKAWEYPYWLDPDIPANGAPSWLDVDLDDQDGLHLVWTYDDKAQGLIGRWVRYAHSMDGGVAWSKPFSIDHATDVVDELRMPNPSVIASAAEVHVVWAGTSTTNREHRYSLDLGETWSETARILGNLEGQAIGDGLAFDSLGRLHFVGQLRFPMAIHHTYWEEGRWSKPEIAYFIKQNSHSDVQGQIGAHNVRLAIGAGNQMVMTFTTGPQDPQSILYAMNRLLEEAPPIESIATPTSTARPTLALPSPTLTPTVTLTPVPVFSTSQPPPSTPLVIPIWIGLIPAAAFGAIVVTVRALRRG